MRPARAVVLALWLGVGAPSLAAQAGGGSMGTFPSLDPAWARAWSPLAPLADLSRTLPQPPIAPALLIAPAPRVGLLWTAGTPAALGAEASDTRARLGLAGSGEGGDYRRPLDPDDVRSVRFEGAGWGGLGTNGAVVGRVLVGQITMDSASSSNIAAPYVTSPFVPTDTTSPTLRRVAAQLEGGIGGQFGGWGAGLTLGVLVNDDHSREASFPRIGRRSVPGVAAGLSRTLPVADLRLAAYGRWLGGAETLVLPGEPQPGIVHMLDGYSEPDPRAVTRTTPFFYRTDRSAWAGGLAVDGRLAGAVWTLYGERTRRKDAQVTDRQLNAPTDYWEGSGWTWGGALQGSAFGNRVLATVWGRYATLSGNATRADLTGDIVRANENVLDLAADIRYTTPDSSWQIATVGSLRREQRVRQDFIASIGSDVLALTPAVGVEIAHGFGSTAVSLGYGIGGYSAASTLPDPAAMGDVYRRLIGPEQELYARRALPMTASLTVRQHTSARTGLFLATRAYAVSPMGEAAGLTLAPTGSRLALDISLGVVLR